MKDLSIAARVYILSTIMIGTILAVWQLLQLTFANTFLLLSTCVIGSLLQVLKIEDLTKRSSYNLNWIAYAFSFVILGAPAALIVIIFSHLVDWFQHRYPWYIQSFNITSFAFAISVTEFVYTFIGGRFAPYNWQGAAAILLGMATFTLVNHIFVGFVLQLARGQSLSESGVFGRLTLLLDFALLCMGSGAALIWLINPYAIVLMFLITYLLYDALRVPALRRQTETEPKTGLFNTDYWHNAVDEELQRAQRFDRPLVIVMADIDLLREINNKYGHLAGDVVLQGTAKILKEATRDYDVVARFGGEEFAILMPETTSVEAMALVELMRQTIASTQFPVSTGNIAIRATMSFGIAQRAQNAQSRDELIHNADTALYHAKENGRNRCYIFEEYMAQVLTAASGKNNSDQG